MTAEGSTYLEQEIRHQAAVLRTVLEKRPADIQETAVQCLGREPNDWVVTGCGDSLFAGMCAEVWFAEAAGIPLRAINALHFSRYLYKGTGKRSIVFALSYSGNTARVVEAAVAARSRGALVVAITANADSRLVEVADHWLPNDALGERSNCRTGSFQAACLLLRMLAGRVAELTGSLPMPAETGLVDAVDRLAVEAAWPVQRIVEQLPDGLTFTVIGGGYSYPIAAYGAAKLYEAATLPAHAAELEQFVHCEIFPIGEQSCVHVTAPRGASYRRAVEVAGGLRDLHAIVVGISDDLDFARHCSHFIPLPSGLHESFVPFLASVPHQLFALDWARRLGENADLVSNKRVNRPLIERSEQWGAADYTFSAASRT